MAHNCTLKGLYGTLQANNAVDQGPLFNSKPIESSSLQAQAAYAKRMNAIADKQVSIRKTNAAGDNASDSVKRQAAELVNLGRTPEALLPKPIYAKIDKKMTQWDASFKKNYGARIRNVNEKYDRQLATAKTKEEKQAIEGKRDKDIAPIRKEAQKAYTESVAKQFTTARKQIQDAYNQHVDNPVKLKAQLKKMGMSQSDAYYTTEYLSYLENGGPYFTLNPGSGNKSIEALSNTISNVTANKVSYNPMTALYNVAELASKAPSSFGFSQSLKGIARAASTAKAEGVSIFDEIPSLVKKGVYSNDQSALRPQGKFDPVTKSQNLLDNASYFIGGDKGLKEIAYRPKPWNDTFVYQSQGSRDLLTFMSFQFRHMQQYGGWWKNAITGTGATRTDAIKSLATYSLINGLIFGDKAAIPAPVYALVKAFDPELDKQLKAEGIPVAGTVIDKGLIGSVTGLELGKYAQPFGGVSIGVGSDIVNTIKDTIPKALPRAAKQAQEGRVDKSALIMLSALASVSQLHKNGANAATQKAIDAVTKAYVEDDDYLQTALKKFFGRDAVPKKDTE